MIDREAIKHFSVNIVLIGHILVVEIDNSSPVIHFGYTAEVVVGGLIIDIRHAPD